MINTNAGPERIEFTYNIFISYAEADYAWVQGYLLDALTQAGLRCHTEAAFTLGQPRLLAFEQAVQNSQYILLVLSPAYVADSASQFIDLLAQSYGLETTTWPVIPLILKPTQLPPRLAMLTALEATDPADWSNVVQQLGVLLRQPIPGPAPKPPCPYPGMAPFSEAEHKRFFGRNKEIDSLLTQLHVHPFIAVIGPSGSGKSSLVFAGLIPALRRSSLFSSGEWVIRVIRPGANPQAALGAVLPGKRPGRQRLLLVVDQFEEIFTVAQADVVAFQKALLRLTKTDNCYLVLTIRADFYSDLMASSLWPEIRAHRMEISPLNNEGLRQAIVRPAEDVGVFVQTALVERLVSDAVGEPGILPLVQETLLLLWDRLERRFLPLMAYEALVLSFSAYSAMDYSTHTGLQVAMARRADAALADLPQERHQHYQAIARRIFLRLVQFGEGRADTRRQQSVAALRSIDDESDLFEQTLSHLTNRRLLTLSSAGQGTERKVDIAHEALISGWPILQVWLVERREAEQTRRRLEAKAAEWVRLGQSNSGLLDEVELLEAERWLASPDASDLGYNKILLRLVETSQIAIEKRKQEEETARQRELAQAQALARTQRQRAEEQTKAARRFRRLAIVLAVVFLLAVGAAIIARMQTVRAEQLRLVSITQALAAQAPNQTERRRQDERGMLLARQAYLFNRQEQGPSLSQVDNALRTVLSIPHFSPVLRGHQGRVNTIAFSPDSQILASGGLDKRILLWNVSKPGVSPVVLTGHQTEILALAFHPDDQLLASSDLDGFVRLWDVSKPNNPPLILYDRAIAVLSIGFSPDGQILATGSVDGLVRLWHWTQPASAPTYLQTQEGDLDILSVTFSPNGKMLAASGGNGLIWLWDLNQSERPFMTLKSHEGGVRTIAFSPDSQRLASGGIDQTIRLWDLRHLETPPIILRNHSNEVWSVMFSPDGQTLASGSDDRTVKLWHPEQSEDELITMEGHRYGVHAVTFSPNGRLLASGGIDGDVRLWRLDNPSAEPRRLNLPEQLLAVAFSPDGQKLVSSSGSGGIHMWEMGQSSLEPQSFPDHGPILSVAFNPSGQILASGGANGDIFLWQIDQIDRYLAHLQGHTDRVFTLAFAPNDQILASGSWDGKILLWDYNHPNTEPVILYQGEAWIWSVAFSPDGRTLAAGDGNGTILLWNWQQPDMEPTRLQDHQGDVGVLVFSPDGQFLASGGNDQIVRLWHLNQPKKAPTILPGHEDQVTTLAFSPDGQTLASGSPDGIIRLWNLSQPEVSPINLIGHKSSIRSIQFSPDGQTLVSSSEDKTILIWIYRTDILADMVCEHVWRNLTQEEWAEFIGSDIPYKRTCPGLPAGADSFSRVTTITN